MDCSEKRLGWWFGSKIENGRMGYEWGPIRLKPLSARTNNTTAHARPTLRTHFPDLGIEFAFPMLTEHLI